MRSQNIVEHQVVHCIVNKHIRLFQELGIDFETVLLLNFVNDTFIDSGRDFKKVHSICFINF